MAEQTMIPGAPIGANRPSITNDESGTTADRKTETKKLLSANPNAKNRSKQKKLYAHLWAGLLMIIAVMSGYILLGPASRVNAAETTAIYSVSTMNHENTIEVSDLSTHENGQASDLAAIQADMDAIMSQMDSLQAGNYTSSNTYQNNTAINADQINQMSARMNELIRQMNSTYSNNSRWNSPWPSSGHGH